MVFPHSFRAVCKSLWQTPQYNISICTSWGFGSLLSILNGSTGVVALFAAYAFISDIIIFFKITKLTPKSFELVIQKFNLGTFILFYLQDFNLQILIYFLMYNWRVKKHYFFSERICCNFKHNI